MELSCKLFGLSDVALLDTMMCYLLTTQHILRCQILRSVRLYSCKQSTSSKLTKLFISKRPWLLGDVCVAELPRMLDTQGPVASNGCERCYCG